MAQKKVDRYKDSPTLKRDESDGKMKATKKPDAEKAISEEASGASMPVHEVHATHEKERFDLFQKQQKEFMDMHTRHMIANPAADNSEEGA